MRLLDVAEEQPSTLIERLSPILGIEESERVDTRTLVELISFFSSRQLGYSIPEDGYLVYDGDGRRAQQAIYEDFCNDEMASRIIFEEYYFLCHESWLHSKTRLAFDAMVEGGGTAVQFAKRHFDRLVVNTLKLEQPSGVSPRDRYRAVAKWVAVGGPTILGFVEPISAAIGGSVSGYFLLVDP